MADRALAVVAERAVAVPLFPLPLDLLVADRLSVEPLVELAQPAGSM
jgi:hypothetical protein